jgi:S-adenosylmethionine synthetase
MSNARLFSSESVCEGHPDKICDLIADNILDEAIGSDKNSRIACETCCSTGMVMVLGEFDTEKYIDIPGVVRRVVKEIGYTKPELGFDHHTLAVLTCINQQSGDIAMGVDRSSVAKADSIGAGDQGMMFGYATRETKELMPLPITLAHKLTKALTQNRKSGEFDFLRPDGKAQVTICYPEGDKPYVDTVVLSAQHNPEIETEELRQIIKRDLILETLDGYLHGDTKFFINPTGRFVKGGPHGDSGLTGRKIIVDTYGGMCPHGGGSFSGKDPTKVDRSASYYARYVAKNVVAAGLADICQIQVAYAIGRAEPVSIMVETFGTGKISDRKIEAAVSKEFDFRPYNVIKDLQLLQPIYHLTTNYGHFGKDGLPYENTQRGDELMKAASKL